MPTKDRVNSYKLKVCDFVEEQCLKNCIKMNKSYGSVNQWDLKRHYVFF